MGTPVKPGRARNGFDKFAIICATDIYHCDKNSLIARSLYFGVACSSLQVLKYNCLVFPPEKREHIRAMAHYLGTNEYHGALNEDPLRSAEDGYAEDGYAEEFSEHDGMTIELKTEHPVIQTNFPEFEEWTLHGPPAVTLGKLITQHESYTGNSSMGYEEIEKGKFRCKPELLPLPIQTSLLIFLEHIRSRRLDIAVDPVFHAEMFNDVAEKYALPKLGNLVIQAFRYGCRPWINTYAEEDCSFLAAFEMIMNPLLCCKFGQEHAKERGDWRMVEALGRIVGENWGWMRHDEVVMEFLDRDEYSELGKHAERYHCTRMALWAKVLAAPNVTTIEEPG